MLHHTRSVLLENLFEVLLQSLLEWGWGTVTLILTVVTLM